jgi:hypothetical protein
MTEANMYPSASGLDDLFKRAGIANPLAERLTTKVLDETHRWPIKVYVAGKFEDQARLRQWAMDQERELGWQIVSSWLWELGTREECREAGLESQIAKHDLDEVKDCDVFVLDTQSPTETGGREVELGYALAHGKIVLRRGPVWNIFHTLLLELEV